MNGMNSEGAAIVEILEAISRPTAPYHEFLVARAIRGVLEKYSARRNVFIGKDRAGNIIVNYWNSSDEALPALVLAAHTDHPGFHLIRVEGNRILAELAGGLPREDFLIGSGVRIVAEASEWPGTVDSWDDPKKHTLWITSERMPDLRNERCFAVPDVPDFEVELPRVTGRAMDDLAGCAMQIRVFERVVDMRVPIDLILIFHRAEEVGFMGAAGACELKSIPMESIVVSLEASKFLDDAEPGGGIVIREGDRLYLFDRNAQQILEEAARDIRERGCAVQKRRMDGGVCEASLYAAYGFETTALAVPLINYHNNGAGRIAAEAVHLSDLESGVELLVQAAKRIPTAKYVTRARFVADRKARFKQAKHRLWETAGLI